MRGFSGYSYHKVPHGTPTKSGSEACGWQYSLEQPRESKADMTDWPTEWDIDGETNDAWAVDERQLQGLHFIPKVAPSFDGRISWFAY